LAKLNGLVARHHAYRFRFLFHITTIVRCRFSSYRLRHNRACMAAAPEKRSSSKALQH
jgi:hypothetical protein